MESVAQDSVGHPLATEKAGAAGDLKSLPVGHHPQQRLCQFTWSFCLNLPVVLHQTQHTLHTPWDSACFWGCAAGPHTPPQENLQRAGTGPNLLVTACEGS